MIITKHSKSLIYYLMNGPQRTAISGKVLWQKWKQNKFLSIL